MKKDLSFLHDDSSQWPEPFSRLAKEQPSPSEERLNQLWSRIEDEIAAGTAEKSGEPLSEGPSEKSGESSHDAISDNSESLKSVSEKNPSREPSQDIVNQDQNTPHQSVQKHSRPTPISWARRNRPYLAAASILLALTAGWFWMRPGPSPTLAIDSSRGLTIQRSGELVSNPEEIRAGDNALLTEDGYLDLSLSDQTRITFEASRMDFHQIDKKTLRMEIYLRDGSLTISSSDDSKNVTVRTPNGIYRIVGTVARVQSRGQTDRVDVLEGQVLATVNDGNSTTVVPVNAETSLKLDQGQAITQQISPEARDALEHRQDRLESQRKDAPVPDASVIERQDFSGSPVIITLSDGQILRGLLAPRLRGMPYTIRTENGVITLERQLVKTVKHVNQ